MALGQQIGIRTPKTKKISEEGWRLLAFLLSCALLLLLYGSCLASIKLTESRLSQNLWQAGADREIVKKLPDTATVLFPRPEVPLLLETPHDKALYCVEHFWDRFDFQNGAKYLEENRKLLDESFVDFLGIALSLPLEEVKDFLTIPAEKSHGELFRYFEEMYRLYLYEKNSPFQSEEHYISVLEWYSTSPKTDLALTQRSQMMLRLLKRNRVGNMAEDFSFTQLEGGIRRLRDYRGKPTLLFFYTPGCEGCIRATDALIEDPTLTEWLLWGRLNLLYIYVEEDIEAFKRSLSTLPEQAVPGINEDLSVINTPLYDLKDSPTLYLLDAKGYVLLKDASVEEISRFLTDY